MLSAFGVLRILRDAPNVLPPLPGPSAFPGVPLLFVTSRQTLGRSTLWIPCLICERSISRDFFALMGHGTTNGAPARPPPAW
jgi:hypothetical protein